MYCRGGFDSDSLTACGSRDGKLQLPLEFAIKAMHIITYRGVVLSFMRLLLLDFDLI